MKEGSIEAEVRVPDAIKRSSGEKRWEDSWKGIGVSNPKAL